MVSVKESEKRVDDPSPGLYICCDFLFVLFYFIFYKCDGHFVWRSAFLESVVGFSEEMFSSAFYFLCHVWFKWFKTFPSVKE